MGRAERRKAERRNRIASNKDSVRMTRDDIRRVEERAQEGLTAYSTEALLTCFALANRRLYKHGVTRTMRTLNYIDELMGAVINDEATIEDYKKELEDEIGLVVKFGG